MRRGLTNQQLFNWVADADELLARLAGVDSPEARVLQQRVEAGIAYAKDAIKTVSGSHGPPAAAGQQAEGPTSGPAVRLDALTRPGGLLVVVGVALAAAAVIAAERWRR